jgi:predicted ATP-grasp superfamily ATP-dependent carboligase
MAKARVLVTDADTPKSLAIVRALGDQYEVWTAAGSRIALAAWSRYTHRHVTYSSHLDSDFCSSILRICCDNEIQIVIPPEESSSLLLARDADRLKEHGITVAALRIEALERVIDKTKTIEAAQRLGIRVPHTEIPIATSELPRAGRQIGYPVVLKPRSTKFWDGHRFIDSPSIMYASSDEQLRRLIPHIDSRIAPPIVQKFIPGEGVGVCMLIGTRGDVLAEFAHRRLRDYRPTGSGSVLRQSIALTPQLRDASARLLRHLGCHGVAMVEFRVEEGTGEAYLMEINGRFWGSLQLAIDSGVNFPSLLIDWLMGKRVEKPSYKEGVILRWWIGDFIRTLRVLRGRPMGFTGVFPSRLSAIAEFLGPQPSGTKNEVLRWTDCWPSLIEPISVMRKLVA